MSESLEPAVPASRSLPEITVKALLLGAFLSALLAGANAYLGLKVGLTVSASIPAAVISMAILRMFRNSNLLENNIVQTAASAGEALAAGVIFTLPALIMLGYWQSFAFFPTLAVAVTGGILGVLYTIPLRRALILQAGLQFPEGVATGEVLKAGASGGKGARFIAIAGIGGALLKLLQTGFQTVASRVSGSVTAGGSVFGIGSELGVALLAVGYIVGLNIAVLVLLGGLISWFLGIPIYMAVADSQTLSDMVGDATGYAAAEEIWSQRIRYLGVGAMATGGLWALVALIKPIRDGVRSSLEAVRAARGGGGGDIPRTERDTPINLVLYGTLALTVPIFIIIWYVVDREALGLSSSVHVVTVAVSAAFALIAGFLFSSVAGYMAGLVGSSNNPISGVTIATVLTISVLLLLLLGSQIDFIVDRERALMAAAAAIMVGGIVCCAAAMAGDNMQDLKAGQIVGATPYKQQIMQFVGVGAAALCIAPVLQLLFSAYGLGDVLPRPGMDADQALSAPQATLMSAVALGVLVRDLPWAMIAIGSGIAIVIIIIDNILERRGSGFRAPVLAVAVGIYLPVELSVPIFVGGMIAHFAARSLAGRSDSDREHANRHGLLFASGLITGEALVGIFLAIPFAAAQSTRVFSDWLTGILPEGLATVLIGGGWLYQTLGIVGFAVFSLWLWRVARQS